MISYGSKVLASANYDFAADPSGGAVGTIKMGLNLPGNIQAGSRVTITNIWVTAKKLLTSGGAATLSFGLQAGVNGVLTTNAAKLMAANVLAAFNTNTDAQGNFQPVQGAIGAANPVKLYPSAAVGAITGWDVIMVIGGFPLTAGSLQIDIECNVTPQ